MSTTPITAQDPAPINPNVIRNLSDRLYDKRKLAALEIENKVKELVASRDTRSLERLIAFLNDEFATSANPNQKKGGLIGLAAAALGLNQVKSPQSPHP